MANIIDFDMSIGREKPVTIHHTERYCPFCDREKLTDIIATDGDIVLLKNKYNVLVGAEQFVIIEGAACESDMPEYTAEHIHRLIRFALSEWRRLLGCGRYADVVLFKNFGPLSGGTIRHPHLQLIGFPELNDTHFADADDFTGEVVAERNGVELNIATRPRVGFWEFNIIPHKADGAAIDTLADFIQNITDYLTHHFSTHTTSYNIFFYHIGEQIYVKLLPRFATPPLYIGYGIRVRPTNIEAMVAELRALYFSDPNS